MAKTPQILAFLLLIYVVLISGCSDKKVQNVKIEAEANQIIDVLGENGIRANKTPTGEGERKSFDITISGDEEMLAAAIQLMEDHCLGQPEPAEIQGGTVITSIEVERAREQRRQKMNIESQLRKLAGVTCVDVNFVPPQDRSLAINPYPSTASVLVTYKTPTFPISPNDIAALVARSVPALQPENVSVVLSSKPLRPITDFKSSYNFNRIALISGIGLVTIIGIFSALVFFRKSKRNQPTELAEENTQTEQLQGEQPLLNYQDDFDDDEDEIEP